MNKFMCITLAVVLMVTLYGNYKEADTMAAIRINSTNKACSNLPSDNQSCYQAENTNNTEYICSDVNRCWTEVK